MEDFSVVCIARNEMSCLPRLTNALRGVEDLVLLDTGSTDGTAEWAEANGWRVERAGDKFRYAATKEQVEKFKKLFGFEPSFVAGDTYFHFADARNEALKYAKNDWCFQPDIDEIPDWDLEKVRQEIQGEDQLVYRFCFAHKPDGSCGLEFSHCKFFRRSKVKWVNQVHEIHAPIDGQAPKQPKWTEAIYHHHWQNKETPRGGYLKGLELDLTNNPDNDRNLYYLGREYFWQGMFQKAIDMFDVAFRKMWWKPEIGQAYIWKSLAHQALGQDDKALECLFASVAACDTRREPFYELGEYYCKRKQYDQAITWWLAALGVPFRAHGYLNNKDLYGWKIHDRLASAYFCVGDKSKARDEWHKAIQFDDCPPVVLQNIKQFYDCEKISIVVPTCRPEGFKRLKRSIEALTVYPDYEIIERPEAGTAIDKFNNGVEESNGDYIVFMADDTEATLGWLVKAYVHLQEKLRGRGCVIFNDGHWHGTLANHFLISKNMREELDGHIWYPGYFHNGVDCELYCRLEAKRLIGYCEYAKIIHYHHYSGTPGYEWDPADEWTAKVNETALRDRKLLVRRLYGLGLIEDAKRFEEWLKQYMASQK